MKTLLSILFLLQGLLLFGQTSKSPPATLKSILLEELKSTHNKEGWFVPVSIAVQGVTGEQANWKDRSGNHSIIELVNHLTFWDQRYLEKFQGQKTAQFSGDNEQTFRSQESWEASVRALDKVLTEWEQAVQAADDTKLSKWASTIAHVATHNAYHTGEIVYIRRQQGSWNPKLGVH